VVFSDTDIPLRLKKSYDDLRSDDLNFYRKEHLVPLLPCTEPSVPCDKSLDHHCGGHHNFFLAVTECLCQRRPQIYFFYMHVSGKCLSWTDWQIY
jgi:hypothetical protein